MTGAYVGVVLFYFVCPVVGTGLVAVSWILLATGVIPSCKCWVAGQPYIVLGI